MLILCMIAPGVLAASAAKEQGGTGPYTYAESSRDGIGKFYMGREISRVMGHLGAGWLERSGRTEDERTDLLIEHLPFKSQAVAVDLGAGTGYFSFPMARKMPSGRVIAVDIQPEMLAMIGERAASEGVTNITTVLATEEDPRLPENSVDFVLLVDAYHEFSHPREVMLQVFESLKAGGQVFLVEYRAEDPSVPIKPLHKMSEAQAIRELTSVGFRWKETLGFLPQQHFFVFEKPTG